MGMYAKLFTSIYQGTLRGNSHGLLVFTNLLAHADQAGVVDIHPRAIADEVGLTHEQVCAALLELEAPDVESRSPEEEGRRIVRLDGHRAWGWRIVNYLKYRSIRNEEDRREQNREAQQRWRERKQRKPESAEGKPDKPIQKEKEKQKEKTDTGAAQKRAAVSLSDLVEAGVNEQHASDWFAVRKAKGMKTLTVTAWDGVQAEASKAGMAPAEAVRLAAASSWAGFKASWLEPKKSGHAYTARGVVTVPETPSTGALEAIERDAQRIGTPEEKAKIAASVAALAQRFTKRVPA